MRDQLDLVGLAVLVMRRIALQDEGILVITERFGHLKEAVKDVFDISSGNWRTCLKNTEQ